MGPARVTLSARGISGCVLSEPTQGQMLGGPGASHRPRGHIPGFPLNTSTSGKDTLPFFSAQVSGSRKPASCLWGWGCQPESGPGDVAPEQGDSTAERVIIQEGRDETEPCLKMPVSTRSAHPFT